MLFQVGPSVILFGVENEDIWFLTERNWSQESFHGNDTGYHLVPFVMYTSRTKAMCYILTAHWKGDHGSKQAKSHD